MSSFGRWCGGAEEGRVDSVERERPHGRSREGVRPMCGVRVHLEPDAHIDAWIAQQPARGDQAPASSARRVRVRCALSARNIP
jgi:hypothetical protein